MIKFERKFLQLIVLAMHQRKLETCGIGTFVKEGPDYLVSDFCFSEYMGEYHPSMDGSEIATGASTFTNPEILHKYRAKHKGVANVQWHSHSNLNVFWSGTDERNIKKWPSQELISIVSNNNLDILIRHDKAFLSGIETQTLFRGHIRNIPEEMKFGEKLTKLERKEFLELCPLRKSITDNSTYLKEKYHRLQSSAPGGLVPLLPWF